MNVLLWDRILNFPFVATFLLVLLGFLPLFWSVLKTWMAQDEIDE